MNWGGKRNKETGEKEGEERDRGFHIVLLFLFDFD